jgi:methionyl-tRNA formyltransferase
MRFAITLSDRYLGVFDALLRAGWQPVRMFGAPADGRMFRNLACMERAQNLKLPLQLSRIADDDLKRLGDQDCQLLVVASYPWRIGAWQAHLPYAINFHPSLLPAYRGPYPLVNGLLDQAARWGASCHQLDAGFDTGAVLAQQGFDVAADETHETLDLKTQMALAALADQVASNFHALWQAATPQGEGSYAPLLLKEDAQRQLDFSQPVEAILRRVRAFGRFECTATLNGVTVYVSQACGWREQHGHPPGTLVHNYALEMVVACADGYIALLQWHLASAEAVLGTSR